MRLRQGYGAQGGLPALPFYPPSLTHYNAFSIPLRGIPLTLGLSRKMTDRESSWNWVTLPDCSAVSARRRAILLDQRLCRGTKLCRCHSHESGRGMEVSSDAVSVKPAWFAYTRNRPACRLCQSKIEGRGRRPEVLRCFRWKTKRGLPTCCDCFFHQSQRDCIIQPSVGPIQRGPTLGFHGGGVKP